LIAQFNLLHELYQAWRSAAVIGEISPRLHPRLRFVDRWRRRVRGREGLGRWLRVGITRLCSEIAARRQYAGDPAKPRLVASRSRLITNSHHITGANHGVPDTFQRNIDWASTQVRYEDAVRVAAPRPSSRRSSGSPGVVAESEGHVDSASFQISDARPRSYSSRQQDIMDGAVWRDPERIQEWIGELSKSDPVVVFCAYGFHVGCKTAIALREAGFNAKYMKGGHSAWKAIGGPIKLYT
jgi:Fe-Mn family superoxide dismutase